ncbi:UNVERIFIED_CONTAM: Retrovirus-related Pol polyprotein from transposon RE2 [Sesamum radiatum]|uniref:Retrovirus-related Pol polyprotein from transposon RE2 n=1 Tax=Sesamum radiatum TaxID=300843 RepID=A0AAW2JNB7_SESRA
MEALSDIRPDILQDVGLLQAEAVTTPLLPGIKFSAEAGNALPNPAPYRRLIGRFLYLGFTKPDIAHATQQLSQYLQHPCKEHWDAATHVIRYLKGTMTKGLFFPVAGPLELRAYCDADWACCKDTRRSLIGYCIFFGHGLISWKTKIQITVSRSTVEAEYRSMGAATCELTWVYNIMHDLQFYLIAKAFEQFGEPNFSALRDMFQPPTRPNANFASSSRQEVKHEVIYVDDDEVIEVVEVSLGFEEIRNNHIVAFT